MIMYVSIALMLCAGGITVTCVLYVHVVDTRQMLHKNMIFMKTACLRLHCAAHLQPQGHE